MTQRTIWDKIDKNLIPVGTDVETTAPTEPQSSVNWLQMGRRGIRDLIAALVWTYILLQIFVLDVDTTVITPILPGAASYLRYKVFVPLFLFVLIALFWRKLLLPALYIGFFPFILLLWRLPRTIFRYRRGATLLCVSNMIGTVLSSFRFNLVSVSFWLLASVLSVAAHAPVPLIMALFTFFVILVRSYYRAVRYSFTGSRFITVQTNLISRLAKRKDPLPNTRLDAELTSDAVVLFSQPQLDKFKNTLGGCIALNKFLSYWAYHLDEYRSGPLPYLFSIVTYIWLFLITLFTLSFANIAILHLDDNSFSYVTPPSILTMVHFALASLVVGTIPQVTASSDLAQTIQIIAGIFRPSTWHCGNWQPSIYDTPIQGSWRAAGRN